MAETVTDARLRYLIGESDEPQPQIEKENESMARELLHLRTLLKSEWDEGYSIADTETGEVSKWHFTKDRVAAEGFAKLLNEDERFASTSKVVRARVLHSREFYLEAIPQEAAA